MMLCCGKTQTACNDDYCMQFVFYRNKSLKANTRNAVMCFTVHKTSHQMTCVSCFSTTKSFQCLKCPFFLSLICAESNNKENPDGKDHKSRVLFSAIDDSELFTDKMELYEDEKSKSVNTVLHRYTHSGSIQKSSGQEPKVG